MLKRFFVPNAVCIKYKHFLGLRAPPNKLTIKHVWVPHQRGGHPGGVYFLEASNVHVELLDVPEKCGFVKNNLFGFWQKFCVESEVPNAGQLARHWHQRNCEGQKQERTHSSYESSETASDEPVRDSGFEEPASLMRFVEHNSVFMSWHFVERTGVVVIVRGSKMQLNKLPHNLVLEPMSFSMRLLTKVAIWRSGRQNIYCTLYYPRCRLCPQPTFHWSTYVFTRSRCLSWATSMPCPPHSAIWMSCYGYQLLLWRASLHDDGRVRPSLHDGARPQML